MASLIKNQIVKHLSKFTKNLSPDKIQLSTLKGEGELKNLELNEEILMELMDLPTWLKLHKAVCNQVNIKIQWSKLKSQPIQLILDEVQISMEMCEELRQTPNTSGLPSYSSGGRYGFGDRVVDGMHLQINTVIIDFKSKAFKANLNLSRIVIQSKTPSWKTANDLQYTRISEKNRDLLLTFKEVSWQTLKIEADCMVEDGKAQTTPLRLITNQSKIRISVKKRYSDCSTVATKFQFLMDDLLWIITDSQMKAAVVFAKHLKDNMDKANEQSKQNAAQKLQKQRQAQQKPTAQTRGTSNSSPVSVAFARYDIPESSYHVQTGRIDLHICDDVNVKDRTRLVDGGAVGIAVMKLGISHYPMRTVGDSRKSWQKYDDNMAGRDEWTAELINNYVKQLEADQSNDLLGIEHSGPAKNIAAKLVERLTSLTVEDFFITSASKDKEQANRPAKLLMSDKKALFLPTEMSAVHLEHTEYFFDHKTSLPAPCPNAYLRINPIKLVLDTYTLMWFNSFALSIAKDVDELLLALPLDTNKKKERMELRLEALMPKIVLPVVGPTPQYQHDRPNSLQLLISRLIITNNHVALSSKNNSLDAHRALVERHQKLSLYRSKEFPNEPSTDIPLISPDHIQYDRNNRLSYTVKNDADPSLEIMSIELEQFWMEFTGVQNSGTRPVSFLESFPVTVWISLPDESSALPGGEVDLPNGVDKCSKGVSPGPTSMSVLIDIGAKICAQLNHYQYCFLMRLADSFTEMGDTIAKEVRLHEDLFNGEDGKVIIPTVDKVTVMLHVREVQFAMLAKPGINISDTASSIDAHSYPDEIELLVPAQDVRSVSPSAQKDPLDQIENALDILPSSQNVSNGVDIVLSVSPPDSDSGVVGSVSGSFASSMDTDLHLERSTFYQNVNTSDTNQRKNGRSSFYTTDTLLPPTDPPTANKFSSAFNKMTNRVRSSMGKGADDVDNSDSMSIASGLSDDYDLLAEIACQEEEAAFTSSHTGGLNDDEPESIISSNMTDRPKQLAFVTVFKLCDIEVGLHTMKKDMAAKVAVGRLDTEDRGNMYYEEFQAQQLSDMNSYSKVENQGDKKPIRVRFSKGPAAADLAYGADELGFAHIQVSDYELSFISSTVEKIGPLFADESVASPLPLLIEIANFDFELKDDAPPVYNTEKPVVPVKLHINKVSLVRTTDGILTVQGETLLSDENSVLKQKAVQHSEKSTNTVLSPEQGQLVVEETSIRAKNQLRPTNSSAQLLQEMKYLQDENTALKEQIMRLNQKLIEKDHEEFERVESTPDEHFEMQKELEFYKKETVVLRSQQN